MEKRLDRMENMVSKILITSRAPSESSSEYFPESPTEDEHLDSLEQADS